MSDNKYNGIGPAAGFTYQEFYFLLRLLQMKVGETVSFEKIDDVGVETDERQSFYQLKHTVATTATNVVNLTTRDVDLWKTLHLWVCLIQDRDNDVEKRTVEEQKQWLARSIFILVTNKDEKENDFCQWIQSFQRNEISIEELKEKLKKLKDDTKSTDIKKYMQDVENLVPLDDFLKRITFESRTDEDIINEISDELKNYHYVPKEKTEDVTRFLLGAIKMDFVHTLQKKVPLSYTKEEFVNQFGPYITEYSKRKFIPSSRFIHFQLPEDPWNQTFVRQLIDIKDLKLNTDIDDLNEYTQSMLRFQNDYFQMINVSGRSFGVQLEREAKGYWKNAFKSETPDPEDNPTEKSIVAAAKKVLAKVRDKNLKVDGDEDSLDINYSNGCYYYFSDGPSPRLGWRMDWKEKYNGEQWITD